VGAPLSVKVPNDPRVTENPLVGKVVEFVIDSKEPIPDRSPVPVPVVTPAPESTKLVPLLTLTDEAEFTTRAIESVPEIVVADATPVMASARAAADSSKGMGRIDL